MRAWATGPPCSTDAQGVLFFKHRFVVPFWIPEGTQEISAACQMLQRSYVQLFPLEETGESHTGYVLAPQTALDASAWVSCPYSVYKITALLQKERRQGLLPRPSSTYWLLPMLLGLGSPLKPTWSSCDSGRHILHSACCLFQQEACEIPWWLRLSSPKWCFYRMPTNIYHTPGNTLLEHECEDTKAVGSGGGLLWVEGAKPGAFLSILHLGGVHRIFFRAICIWDRRVHNPGSADTGHH